MRFNNMVVLDENQVEKVSGGNFFAESGAVGATAGAMSGAAYTGTAVGTAFGADTGMALGGAFAIGYGLASAAGARSLGNRIGSAVYSILNRKKNN
jgi:hypothetical protein